MNRREFIATGASCAVAATLSAADKKADGGFAPVSWPDRTAKVRPVLPPGAHSCERFASRCVGCGLCAAVCPSKCLRPSTDPKRRGRVELDFRYGWCRPGCTKCAEVCPTGAIERVASESKRLYHVGFAVWDRERCVRTRDGVECHACEKHCPVKAVKIVAGFPVVDRIACIGCGACEHYCPARPETAVRVVGVERHREIEPISEDDVIDEMKSLINASHSAVVARGGVIVAVFDGRGLAPIEKAIGSDEGVFRGALVADKVVGVAAARIYVRGGAAKVWGKVMSKGAFDILAASGIAASYDSLVEELDCEKGKKGEK